MTRNGFRRLIIPAARRYQLTDSPIACLSTAQSSSILLDSPSSMVNPSPKSATPRPVQQLPPPPPCLFVLPRKNPLACYVCGVVSRTTSASHSPATCSSAFLSDGTIPTLSVSNRSRLTRRVGGAELCKAFNVGNEPQCKADHAGPMIDGMPHTCSLCGSAEHCAQTYGFAKREAASVGLGAGAGIE